MWEQQQHIYPRYSTGRVLLIREFFAPCSPSFFRAIFQSSKKILIFFSPNYVKCIFFCFFFIFKNFTNRDKTAIVPATNSVTPNAGVHPSRTAVSLSGQTTQISSSLSPKRDCGSKGVNINETYFLCWFPPHFHTYMLSGIFIDPSIYMTRFSLPIGKCVFGTQSWSRVGEIGAVQAAKHDGKQQRYQEVHARPNPYDIYLIVEKITMWRRETVKTVGKKRKTGWTRTTAVCTPPIIPVQKYFFGVRLLPQYDIPRSRCLVFWYRYTWYLVYSIYKIQKQQIDFRCEIEDLFVETHLCKLCVILRSRALRAYVRTGWKWPHSSWRKYLTQQ